MRFRLIEDHRDLWPVRVICDALSVAFTLGGHGRRAHARSPAASCWPIFGESMPSTGNATGRRAFTPNCALRARRQPQAGRAAHAPARHPGVGAAALSRLHDRQQAFPARGGKPAEPELCRRPARSDLAGRYNVYPDRRGLALPGRAARPVHPQGRRLGHARSHACRTHHRRAHHGNPTATPESGLVHHSDSQ